MKMQLRLRQLREGEFPVLRELAKADDHELIAPTYVVQKGDEMVGYIGIVPTIVGWMDTKKTNVRDSILLFNSYENILSVQGGQIIGLACTEESPYRKYLAETGYQRLGAEIFLKNLNP